MAHLVCFVSKKVDFIILLFDILQAEGFVPPLREDIKADLAPNGVSQPQVAKLFLKSLNECFSATTWPVGVNWMLAAASHNESQNLPKHAG